MVTQKTAAEIIQAVCPLIDTASTVTANIWTVFREPDICKSSGNDLTTVEATYLAQIQKAVAQGKPVPLILIAFPFKMWRNPLKTSRKTPDLGELLFLATMVNINRRVRQYYLPGITWTILTEGEAYTDLFTVPQAEIDAYIAGIKNLTTLLGAEQLFNFVPLQNVYDEFREFPDAVKKCHAHLESTVDFTEKVHTEILWTFITSQDVREYPTETLRKIYRQSENGQLTHAEEKIKQYLENNARKMALHYLAANTAKHQVGKQGAVQDLFPNHLYVSVTKKAGRYAFHPLNKKTRYLPHHGVPVLRQMHGQVRIQWQDDLTRYECCGQFQPVYLEGDPEKTPFYYNEDWVVDGV